MAKKIPLRRCIVTHEQFPKKELIRIVRTPEKKIEIDLTGKKNGRGAYVKKDPEVIRQAQKNKALDRVFEMHVEDEVYEELISMLTSE